MKDDVDGTRTQASSVPGNWRGTAEGSGAPAVRPTLATRQVEPRERYELIAEHGRGGLGRVSRARDHALERDVAIKELIKRTSVAEVRFFREALITARLEHPGIVPVHEAGRWPDGTPFYAMKLVAGRPLRALIAERTTVEDRLGLLHHVIAVADAIAYAHDRHIIHRDLKPANVIVGDFGETVVIDWGLAKDLSASDDEPSGGAAPPQHDLELTQTGAVLGTPAYMAPEQARGEAVDPRADVFAIGAMLWELCALDKVPPADRALRHRLLRRANIDGDLIAIIDQALAPDPAQRYPSAGPLAADLKAFKTGARIAARRYTLPGVLAHWIRRHRALAGLAGALIALAVVATIVYVRGVAAERAHTADALDDLTLEHAELLLHSDPTATAAALRGYRGPDATRRAMLDAEATGRGVALQTLRPHHYYVNLVAEQPDGAVVTGSEDFHLTRTTATGNEELATDVAMIPFYAYTAERHRLVYTTMLHELALIDLGTGTRTVLSHDAPMANAFSPDGERLASLDKLGTLRVRASAPPYPERLHRAVGQVAAMAFVGADALALFRATGTEILHLDTGTTDTAAPIRLSADVRGAQLAIGQASGELAVLDDHGRTLAAAPVCQQGVSLTRFVPVHDQLGFACGEGGGGIARVTADAIAVTARFTTPRPLEAMVADPAGRYLAASADRTVYAYFLQSGLLRSYEGQGAMITALAATPGTSHVVVGDVDGNVRVWDFQPPPVDRLATLPARPSMLLYAHDGRFVVSYSGAESLLRVIRTRDGAVTELRGHTRPVWNLRLSDDSHVIASYAFDGTARAWDPDTGAVLGVLDAHHGAIEDLQFVPGTHRMISIGDDGRVLHWDVDRREVTPCVERATPLIQLEVIRSTGDTVILAGDNTLFVVSPACTARPIATLTAPLTYMTSSADGRRLAVGDAAGQLAFYDTATWRITQTLHVTGKVGSVVIDPTRPLAVVGAKTDGVYLIALDGGPAPGWHKLSFEPRFMRFAPDGNTLAIGVKDGGAWLYTLATDTWRYTHDHALDVISADFSPDSTQLVTGDKSGLVVRRTL